MIAIGLIAGCGSQSSDNPRPDLSGSRPVAQPATSPVVPDPVRNKEKETSSQVLAYPTGDRATSVILLEKKFPTQARLGQIYKYQIQVTNLKEWPISGVVIREDFPPSFAVAKDPNEVTPGTTMPIEAAPELPSDDIAEPAQPPPPATLPTTAPVQLAPVNPLAPTLPVTPITPPASALPNRGNDVRYVQNIGYVRDVEGTWWGTATRREKRGVIAQEYLIGTLEPGQVKLITVAGVSEELGKLDTRSMVTYTPVLAGGTDVINPILKLTKEAPRHADLCEPIEFRYVIENIGVGTETEVRIDEALPEGLLTDEGKPTLRIVVGDLPEKQSRSFVVKVRAARTGEFSTRAQARGFGTATQSSELATAVHAPKLAIAMTGPASEYVGKAGTYEVTITNIGDAAARNTVLSAVADGGAAVQYPAPDAATRPAVGGGYAVGLIEPGKSKKVRITARPVLGGQLSVKATARADCADAVNATSYTEVKTIAAPDIQVSDVDDPVRVGEVTRYRITLSNGGSGADRNVKVVATLPPQLKFVQATGPTPAISAGGKITFDALPRLDAGQTVTWLVEVRAEEAGDVRFRAEMTSDSLSEPVIGTQSTRLY